MAAITAQAVNELRKRTGLGLMECKSLLKDTDGDIKQAQTLAQERNLVKASGRSGRATNAGRIEAAFNADRTSGALIELNCETDFVARNDTFRQMAKALAEQVLNNGDANVESQPFHLEANKTVKDVLIELNARTGENIALARSARFSGGGRVEAYVHHDAKSGALVELEAPAIAADALGVLAKDLSLQVVAAKPLAVDRNAVSADVVAEQKRIFLAQVESQMADKPAQVREKIAFGKLEAWFGETVLIEQPFVKDAGHKVREIIDQVGKGITVKRFARFVVGEDADAEKPQA